MKNLHTITNSSGNGVVMIEYLVFVALHAAKASSTDILLNERLFFYLHIMWVDISLETKSVSLALSCYGTKGISKSIGRLPLIIKPKEQDPWISRSRARAPRSLANNVY